MPYLEIDTAGTILQTNKEGSSILTAATRPVTGRSLFDFVTDSHVRRLRDYLGTCGLTDAPGAIEVLLKGRGVPVELRIRRHDGTHNAEYFSVLMHHSSHLNGSAGKPADDRAPMTFPCLLAKLNRAYTRTSVYQLIGEYCRTALASPEGMIFVEDQGKYPGVSHWQSSSSRKFLSGTIFTNGLLSEVFRTENPNSGPAPEKGGARFRINCNASSDRRVPG